MTKPLKPLARGVICPRCHSRKTPAVETRRIANCTVRFRQCRDCGKLFKCIETAAHHLLPDPPSPTP